MELGKVALPERLAAEEADDVLEAECVLVNHLADDVGLANNENHLVLSLVREEGERYYYRKQVRNGRQ